MPGPTLVRLRARRVPPADHLAQLLTERGQTLAVAEGATGGMLCHLLTQVPGASQWLRAGIVAYTDHPKQLLLRVATETLEERGSISAESTVQMARLARRLFGADWGLAVTGYADHRQPSAARPAQGAPERRSPGTPEVAGEPAAPQPGLTYVAIAGLTAGGDADTQTWEEWLFAARDRASYKRAAAEGAMRSLIKLLES